MDETNKKASTDIEKKAANSSQLLIFILILITLLSIGIASYSAYQTIQLNKQINQLKSQSSSQRPESIQPSPSPDPTANWEVYTNKYGKFSFKYPSTWYLQESIDNEDALDAPRPNNVLKAELKHEKNKEFDTNNRISITVTKVDSENNLNSAKDVLESWRDKESKLEKVLFNGANGYKLTWTYNDLKGSESRVDYRLEKNGLLYSVELSIDDNTSAKKTVYDQGVKILSTLELDN